MTALQFCSAFAKQWNEDAQNRRNAILTAFPDNCLWKEYMETSQDSFLSRLAINLEYAISKQFYYLDVIYYREEEKNETLFPGPEKIYPHCLYAIIEHENGECVQEEMYKQLIFRSPLKVLIFYDYNEYEKVNNQNREMWLENKLNALLALGNDVRDAWPESEYTEYLFLVGNKNEENEIPVWRYWIAQQGNFKEAGIRLDVSD